LGRLALGAKLSTSQLSTPFQKRMNRKMGISPINGTHKTGVKKHAVNGDSTHGPVYGNGKGKMEVDSDSEEDSKSRLIKKLSSKKLELTQSSNKKNISKAKSTVHAAIIQTSPKPSITSPILQHPPAVSVYTTNVSSNTAHQKNGTHAEAPSIPDSTDIRISNDSQVADNDKTEDPEKQERKRRKKEKKKEQKRLKKLGKGDLQG
jgi:hypothetical protein